MHFKLIAAYQKYISTLVIEGPWLSHKIKYMQDWGYLITNKETYRKALHPDIIVPDKDLPGSQFEPQFSADWFLEYPTSQEEQHRQCCYSSYQAHSPRHGSPSSLFTYKARKKGPNEAPSCKSHVDKTKCKSHGPSTTEYIGVLFLFFFDDVKDLGHQRRHGNSKTKTKKTKQGTKSDFVVYRVICDQS